MPCRKVGCLERLWHMLRRKLCRLFVGKRYVYDYYVLTEYENLESIIRTINENGYQLVCFTPYEGDLVVFFRRPVHG